MSFLGSPFKVEVIDMISVDEFHDKRLKGGLVGSLNILEVDCASSEGKIEAIVTG